MIENIIATDFHRFNLDTFIQSIGFLKNQCNLWPKNYAEQAQ
jgi:hypothetical protein